MGQGRISIDRIGGSSGDTIPISLPTTENQLSNLFLEF
jgi:hypothetical protein